MDRKEHTAARRGPAFPRGWVLLAVALLGWLALIGVVAALALWLPGLH